MLSAYYSRYADQFDRKKERNRRIRTMYQKLRSRYDHQSAVDRISDHFFLSPELIHRVVKSYVRIGKKPI